VVFKTPICPLSQLPLSQNKMLINSTNRWKNKSAKVTP
jgi:hypothetical protein